jgi:hypothetical protein
MSVFIYTASWCKLCTVLKNEVYGPLQQEHTQYKWHVLDIDEIDDDHFIPPAVPFVRVTNAQGGTTELSGYAEINNSLELML